MQADHTTRRPSLKLCPQCSEKKPATTEYFPRKYSWSDKIKPICRECEQANRQSHKERVVERERLYRIVNREHYAELYLAYRKEKAAQIAARARKYRKVNSEYIRERERAYRAKNKLRARSYWNRRRARKLNAQGSHTVEDIRRQYEAQSGRCYYCGIQVGNDYHVDHVVPLSRGGSNGPENLVIACAPCNLSKSDRLPHEWPQGGRLL